MKTLTVEEIVDETVAFYSEDPRRRSLDGSRLNLCLYNGPNGNHCAVGRCMYSKLKNKGQDLRFNDESAIAFFEKRGGEHKVLKAKYRGHEDRFWGYLQALHDDDDNWGPNGITSKGLEEAEYIKEKFGS